MSDDYRLALMEDRAEQYEQLAGLLRLVFPKAAHLTARYLAWQYGANPDGFVVGGNIYSGETLVGHLGGVTLSARIEGEVRKGIFLLNGAVHPEHRRRGIQSRISDALFEEAASQGYSFSLGSGNRYSTKPLLTRHALIGSLGARAGFGRPRLRDGGPAPSFERVWSDEALRWRLANPEARYGVRRHGGAVSVTAASGVPGMRSLLYQGPGYPGLTETGPKGGPVTVWFGLNPALDWKRSAFLTIPDRLRPSPLNLVYRDLTGGGVIPDPSRFVFQGLDLDAF
ncbi:MAG TPA: GNAT family N-acetyltransferase [Allosphingosinicella sp.]|jgi:GNAT superfamily N-acetyltransferase